ncbi:MAG TPA: plastocyanin/azurin family copper-binding protein [Candidatus Limnocylindrales bacterium]|jgi:plastocyanin|nr:plastocyanin/azurin family copper-binding protein [Candidatus Limnocylindrales bacterium]
MTAHATSAGIGPTLRPVLAALAIVASLALVGCAADTGGSGGAGAGGAASPVATTTVDLPPSYRFVPTAIVVSVGATVTWTNHDNFSHNVHFDGADPLPMAPGDTANRTFDSAGTFPYVCSLHPHDMKGSVLVTEG